MMQAEEKNIAEAGAVPAFSPDRRFDRMTRLVGEARMERLAWAHVAVVGIGGVGSWAAESLARSGVGRITLMDFDDVCITNFNRQLHALDGLIGRPKAEVMAERLRSIAPKADIQVLPFFYKAETADTFFAIKPDFVIDAIDCVTSKCHLVSTCRSAGLKMVTSTGSGGRMDPTKIEVADLSETDVDPLARVLRKLLRRDYGFPGEDKGTFGIPAIFSRELPTPPISPTYDGGKGFTCMCGKNNNPFFNCDQRNLIMGNASFVTGVFGLHCAAVAVRSLMGE